MNKSTEHKNEVLGESYGTATGKLRKAILFQLLIEANKNICFQCGKSIEKIEDLSIEHKTPWLSAENPIESFYDLNNIAFSHLSCNSNAAIRKKGTRESTPHGLTRYRSGCRCEICKKSKHDAITTKQYKERNRAYQKRRYNSEEEFRTKNILKSSEYYKDKHCAYLLTDKKEIS